MKIIGILCALLFGCVPTPSESPVSVGSPTIEYWLPGSMPLQTYARYDFATDTQLFASVTYPIAVELSAPGKIQVKVQVSYDMGQAFIPGCDLFWLSDWVPSNAAPNTHACVQRIVSAQLLDEQLNVLYTAATQHDDAGAVGVWEPVLTTLAFPAGTSHFLLRFRGQGTLSLTVGPIGVAVLSP